MTFRPIAKHITNEMPKFRDKSEALRRRAILLTFEQTFRGRDCNKNLSKELFTELPGILKWALEGWKELQKTKQIYESASSLSYKELFAETLNPVLAFIKQACELGNDKQKIKRSGLYEEYRLWHWDNVGDHPLSKPKFFERLRDDISQSCPAALALTVRYYF